MKKPDTVVIVWGLSVVIFLVMGFIMGWFSGIRGAQLGIEHEKKICTKQTEVLQKEIDDLERVFKILGMGWADGQGKCELEVE
jgi:hypothetical protein